MNHELSSPRLTFYEPNSSIAPHHHDELSLIVVVSGSYQERIEARETEHGAGSMLLYPAFATHSQRFPSGGARKLVFSPRPSTLEFFVSRRVRPDRARHMRGPAIATLTARLLAEMRNHDEFAPLAMEGITLELAAAFARGDRKDGSPRAPAWVRAARDLIRDEPERNDSLEEIASRLGRHPLHLAREFRRHFGTSIGAYRRLLRVEKAAAMLRATNVDLTEIALSCGFASHSHLCRSFKAALGATPSEYRNSR